MQYGGSSPYEAIMEKAKQENYCTYIKNIDCTKEGDEYLLCATRKFACKSLRKEDGTRNGTRNDTICDYVKKGVKVMIQMYLMSLGFPQLLAMSLAVPFEKVIIPILYPDVHAVKNIIFNAAFCGY